MTFISLNGLLTFIQAWLPSLTIIVGGGWFFFQWLFAERLRRLKEMPSLDGNLSAMVVACENGKLLVSVEALWNNRSPLPIYLSIESCRVAVFRIDGRIKKGNSVFVLKKDLGDPVCDHHFLVGVCKKDYYLEPNTASTIINHFVLEPGIYGIRMELYSALTVEINWWKEMILDAQLHKSKSHSGRMDQSVSS
jgi:hypothetical protein